MYSYLFRSSPCSGLITLGNTKISATWIFPLKFIISQEDQTHAHTRGGRGTRVVQFRRSSEKGTLWHKFADLESASKTLELVVCWLVPFLNKPAHRNLLWYSAVKLKHLCCRNFLEISLKPTGAQGTLSPRFLLSSDTLPYGKLCLLLLHFKEKFG